MYLFYDTETDGLIKKELPPDHPAQPHIVQLGALLTDDTGAEISSLDVIVKPNGYTIPTSASNVHGITTQLALERGVPAILAVGLFMQLRHLADMVVAHNETFDHLVLDAAVARLGRKPSKPWPKTFCTMEAATPILNVSPTARMRAAGFTKPKPPRLGECYKAFFGEDLSGAHNAMVDVRGCARVFFHLQKLAADEKRVLETA